MDAANRSTWRNAMVLKYVNKNGVRYHEPPYTKEQEAEFYRGRPRVGYCCPPS
jgi:hypothetical protein